MRKFFPDMNPMTDQLLLTKDDPNLISSNASPDQSSGSDQLPYRPQKEAEEVEDRWELRSVVAVFRHGDRTPKQKMKMLTVEPCFLRFFEGKPNLKKEVKLKTPRELYVDYPYFNNYLETIGGDQETP